jgi:hypothetical protein
MLIVLLVFTAALIGLLIWLLGDDGPRCQCGSQGAYMLSDGTWECDRCREARIGGKAPRSNHKNS